MKESVSTTTHDQVIEQYKQWMRIHRQNRERTIKNCERFTRMFLEYLDEHNKQLPDIMQKDIDEYIAHMWKHYDSQNSLVPTTSNLKKFIVHFLGRDDIQIRCVAAAPPKRDKTALDMDEVRRLFDAADTPLRRAVIKTLYYGGMRKKELQCLDIEDYDRTRLQITIKDGKGGISRIVNITEDCARSIDAYLMVRPQPKEGHEKALFLSNRRTRISYSSIYNIVKNLAASVMIEKNTYPHKMRITNITHILEGGGDIKEAQLQSGIRSVRVLMGYTQHTSKKVRENYDKIFGRVSREEPMGPHNKSAVPDDVYRREIVAKYLAGEIDIDTMTNILGLFETDKKIKHLSSKQPTYIQ